MSIAGRYFFYIVTSSGTVADLEGTDFASLDHARAEAILDARELMATAILAGRDISGRSIEIRNEAGDILLVLPFREAIARSD